MQTERQVFFSTWPSGQERYGLSGVEMFRYGDDIYYSLCDFDKEDQRTYEYAFRYSVEEHRRALEELRRTGHVTVKDGAGKDSNFSMSLDGDTVTISFFGCGGSTGGGTPVYSIARMTCKLTDLLLESDLSA